MAIRQIAKIGEPVLRKKAKVVTKFDEKLVELLEDMADTMYEADGVGLAAPQVGILKRIFVIDIRDENGLMVFINPEILETSGSQTDDEGCLSIPGKTCPIERPNYVKVRAFNEKGQQFILEAEELLARAVLHENDHLNGVLYVDHAK